jgi:hypothetical protein
LSCDFLSVYRAEHQIEEKEVLKLLLDINPNVP